MSKQVGKRLRSINYHRMLSAEMRKRWEKEYGVNGAHSSYSLYDITTHRQRLLLDALIEDRTGKWCDVGVSQLTNEALIELLEQVLKAEAKIRGKKLKKEIEAMIA